MAVKAYMRPTLEIIGGEIAAFAAEQGLERSDFAVAGAWQETTGRVGLVLGTNKTVGWFDWYKGILEGLQKRFNEVGAHGATNNAGLVVLSPRTRDELYHRFRLAEGEEDVSDFLETTIDAVWAERNSSATRAVAPR